MRKRVFAGIIAAVLLTGMINIAMVSAAGSDYEVRIVGALESAAAYTIEFQVKTQNGARLNRNQSLDLAYDSSVLRLTTMEDGISLTDLGISLAYTYTALIDEDEEVEVFSGLPANWSGNLYGAISPNGTTGFVSLQPFRATGNGTAFSDFGTLMKIRFVFQAGKTIDDLVGGSIRFLTADEMTALNTSMQILLNDGTDTYSYGFRNGAANTLLIEPEFVLEVGQTQPSSTTDAATTAVQTTTEATTTTAAQTTTEATTTTAPQTTTAVATTTAEQTTTEAMTTTEVQTTTESTTTTAAQTTTEAATTTAAQTTTEAATTTAPQTTTVAATTTAATTTTVPSTTTSTTTAQPPTTPPSSVPVFSGGYGTSPALPPAVTDAPTASPAPTAPPIAILLTLNSNAYSKNGTSYTSDAAPFLAADGRVMVPLRIISEALGANVAWDAATRTVTITLGGKTLRIVIDQQLPDNMGTATIRDSRTFVPIRYIAEQLGAKVIWDESAQTVQITQ